MFDKQLPDDTREKQFLVASNQLPARRPVNQGFFGGILGNEFRPEGGRFKYFDTDGWGIYESFGPGIHVLFVDCKGSTKKLIFAKLFNITFSIEPLLDGTAPEVLQSTTVVNNSTETQTTEVSLIAEIEKQLEMSYKTSLKETVSTTVSGSIDIDVFGFGKLGFSMSRTNEYTKLAETGSVSIERRKTELKFSQTIQEPPKSKTVVRIVTIPIRGSIPFKAYYELSAPNGFGSGRIMKNLERLGFRDIGKMHDNNGKLILEYEGTLSVQTGYDTHVNITSYPLDNGHQNVAMDSQRLKFLHDNAKSFNLWSKH